MKQVSTDLLICTTNITSSECNRVTYGMMKIENTKVKFVRHRFIILDDKLVITKNQKLEFLQSEIKED